MFRAWFAMGWQPWPATAGGWLSGRDVIPIYASAGSIPFEKSSHAFITS